MHMQPVYLGAKEGDADVDRLAAHGNGQHKELQEAVLDSLETALFVREGGFNSECPQAGAREQRAALGVPTSLVGGSP